MKRLIIGLLLATLTLQAAGALGNDELIMMTSRIEGDERVAGGNLATKGQFPWHVTITTDESGFCNGALLDSSWVLTSGRCAHGVTNFTMTLGMTNIFTIEENDTVIIETTVKYVHPLYDERTLINDIALLKLETPLNLTDSADALIAPIRLASHTEGEINGTDVQLSGWGKIRENSTMLISSALSFVNLTVTSLIDCRAAFGMANVHEGMLCTSGEGGRGACAGDEGSPLAVWNDSSWKLLGVASFGAAHGCEQGAPTVYTRTSVYLHWIDCQKDPKTLDPKDCLSGASATVAATTLITALLFAVLLKNALDYC